MFANIVVTGRENPGAYLVLEYDPLRERRANLPVAPRAPYRVLVGIPHQRHAVLRLLARLNLIVFGGTEELRWALVPRRGRLYYPDADVKRLIQQGVQFPDQGEVIVTDLEVRDRRDGQEEVCGVGDEVEEAWELGPTADSVLQGVVDGLVVAKGGREHRLEGVVSWLVCSKDSERGQRRLFERYLAAQGVEDFDSQEILSENILIRVRNLT
jgi:hypothetical protein